MNFQQIPDNLRCTYVYNKNFDIAHSCQRKVYKNSLCKKHYDRQQNLTARYWILNTNYFRINLEMLSKIEEFSLNFYYLRIAFSKSNQRFVYLNKQLFLCLHKHTNSRYVQPPNNSFLEPIYSTVYKEIQLTDLCFNPKIENAVKNPDMNFNYYSLINKVLKKHNFRKSNLNYKDIIF